MKIIIYIICFHRWAEILSQLDCTDEGKARFYEEKVHVVNILAELYVKIISKACSIHLIPGAYLCCIL